MKVDDDVESFVYRVTRLTRIGRRMVKAKKQVMPHHARATRSKSTKNTGAHGCPRPHLACASRYGPSCVTRYAVRARTSVRMNFALPSITSTKLITLSRLSLFTSMRYFESSSMGGISFLI